MAPIGMENGEWKMEWSGEIKKGPFGPFFIC